MALCFLYIYRERERGGGGREGGRERDFIELTHVTDIGLPSINTDCFYWRKLPLPFMPNNANKGGGGGGGEGF